MKTDEDKEENKLRLKSYILFFAYLYNFMVIDHILICDIIKLLVDEFSPLCIELILTMLERIRYSYPASHFLSLS